MRDAAGGEHAAARADAETLPGHLEDMLAFENVEELVVVLVHMERGVAQRRHLLEQGEGAAGVGGRCPNEDRGVAEDEPLARTRLAHHGKDVAIALSAQEGPPSRPARKRAIIGDSNSTRSGSSRCIVPGRTANCVRPASGWPPLRS
jgi:hypothetical protein